MITVPILQIRKLRFREVTGNLPVVTPLAAEEHGLAKNCQACSAAPLGGSTQQMVPTMKKDSGTERRMSKYPRCGSL